ncbi:hypothetical protein Adt_38853 [Abeliophyllum distichum]|uniref:Uncharacterized protein n=1 Tax=Abeliophyllum distichum TaxID=126358 RepID=A0ABD1Q3G4_9LAMI
MSGFYFSSMPKFKIRRSGVVGYVSRLVSTPGITGRKAPEVMAGGSSPNPMALPSETLGQLEKKKAAMGGGDEMAMPDQGMGDGRKSQRVRYGKGGPSSEAENRAHVDQATPRASHSPSVGKTENINIGLVHGRLDPDVLDELPPTARQAAVSVYRYWPPSFAKDVAGADLKQLVRLAEMHTARSHVLNCEVYKMLAVKTEESHSMA